MLTFWQKTCLFFICIYCSVHIGFSIECLFCMMMMLWHWPILVVLSQNSHLHFWQCFQTCWRAIRFVICAENSGVVVGWLVSQGCSFYEPLFSSNAVMDKGKLFRHSTFLFVPRLNRERQAAQPLLLQLKIILRHTFCDGPVQIYRDRVNACVIIYACFTQLWMAYAHIFRSWRIMHVMMYYIYIYYIYIYIYIYIIGKNQRAGFVRLTTNTNKSRIIRTTVTLVSMPYCAWTGLSPCDNKIAVDCDWQF